MKLKINRSTLLISIAAIALISISFTNVFNKSALRFLLTTSEEMMSSLVVVTELEMLAYSGSENIPVIGGTAKGLASELDKASDYLSVSTSLVTAQVILINLSNSVLIKIFSILMLIGIFVDKYKKRALKLLIVSLVISPGLAIYVNIVEYMVDESKLDLGLSLNKELTKTRQEFNKRKKAHDFSMSEKKTRQLAEAKKRGKTKIGFFKKLEDDIEDKAFNIGNKINEEYHLGGDCVKYFADKTMELLINLLVTIIVVFLLLPLLYFYMFNLLIKKFFNIQLDNKLMAEINSDVNKLLKQ